MTGQELFQRLQSMTPEERGRLVLVDVPNDALYPVDFISFAKNIDNGEEAIVLRIEK